MEFSQDLSFQVPWLSNWNYSHNIWGNVIIHIIPSVHLQLLFFLVTVVVLKVSVCQILHMNMCKVWQVSLLYDILFIIIWHRCLFCFVFLHNNIKEKVLFQGYTIYSLNLILFCSPHCMKETPITKLIVWKRKKKCNTSRAKTNLSTEFSMSSGWRMDSCVTVLKIIISSNVFCLKCSSLRHYYVITKRTRTV